MDVMDDPLWETKPLAKQFALEWLFPMEQAELLDVMRHIPVNNVGFLNGLFTWANSPQGDAYWRLIADEIDTGKRLNMTMREVYQEVADAFGVDLTREPQGWQPDVVDGASVMDITRGML
jgi:hypothetical protein